MSLKMTKIGRMINWTGTTRPPTKSMRIVSPPLKRKRARP